MNAQIAAGLVVIVLALSAAILVLRNWSRESAPKPQYSGPLTGYLEANNLRVVTTPDDMFVVVSDRGVPVTDPAETATAAALAAVYCPFDGGGGA